MSVKIPRPPRTDDPAGLTDWFEQVERQLTLVGSRTVNLGNIAAGTVLTFTVPVLGCKADQQQAVAVAMPSTIDADLLWCGLVSADDEVTVRVLNPTGGGINPGNATYGARVFV